MRPELGLALVCAACATVPQSTAIAPSGSEGAGPASLPPAQRSREAAVPPAWVGNWRGEFGGTQEFAALDLGEDGRFRYQLDAGPDASCCVEGTWAVNRDTLRLTPSGGTCDGASLARYDRIYRRSDRAFALADPSFLEHIQTGPGGVLSGPVWMFERDSSAKPSCHQRTADSSAK